MSSWICISFVHYHFLLLNNAIFANNFFNGFFLLKFMSFEGAGCKRKLSPFCSISKFGHYPHLYSWPRRASYPFRYFAQGLHALSASSLCQSYLKHALLNLTALYRLWSYPSSKDSEEFDRPYFTSQQFVTRSIRMCIVYFSHFPPFCLVSAFSIECSHNDFSALLYTYIRSLYVCIANTWICRLRCLNGEVNHLPRFPNV